MKVKVIINVKEKEKSINDLDEFRKKKYKEKDVRFTNVDLVKLNRKTRKNIFDKNDLFISSDTLWEIMQEEGGSGIHNYHGLTAEDIIDALNSINEPYALFESKHSRYAIVTTTLTHFGEPLMIIVEVGAGLHSNINANINKIVTMYPKSNIDIMLNGLDKKDVLLVNAK